MAADSWLAWYETPEGAAFYKEHLADIEGINADSSLNKTLNAFSKFSFETAPEALESAKSAATNGAKWLFLGAFLLAAFYIYRKTKG